MSKTNYLQAVISDLQRTAGPYRCATKPTWPFLPFHYFVIIAFESVEKARAWYDSPAYQELVAVRKKASTATLFIAEGVSN
jgi:hypothetical protein